MKSRIQPNRPRRTENTLAMIAVAAETVIDIAFIYTAEKNLEKYNLPPFLFFSILLFHHFTCIQVHQEDVAPVSMCLSAGL